MHKQINKNIKEKASRARLITQPAAMAAIPQMTNSDIANIFNTMFTQVI